MITNCLWCDAALPPKPPGQRGPAKSYCNNSCRAQACDARDPERKANWTATRNAKLRKRYDHHCRWCDSDFVSNHPRSTTCGNAECKRRYHNARMIYYSGQRRALIRAGQAFNPYDVFDRDGWICWVCKDSIDPSLAYPDPLSVSLEHIIPLGAGGPHAPTNCSCSHLICNLRRGKRG